MKKEYWYGINVIKGILIIAVFIGHFYTPSTRLDGYLIYSFHMPLFIGISGFLFRIENDYKITDLIKKYYGRLIVPWIIAVVAYYIINNIVENKKMSFGGLIKSFIFPFCHLWYVLGLLSYIMIMVMLWKVFCKFKHKWLILFFIALAISILSKYEIIGSFNNNYILVLLFTFFDSTLKLQNLIFFALGIYCRYIYENNGFIIADNITFYARIAVIVLFFLDVLSYFSINETSKYIIMYLLNIVLIPYVIYLCTNNKLKKCGILEFIGSNSLPIYLYHIFVGTIVEVFFARFSLAWYIALIPVFIVECVFVYYLRKCNFINRVIFGSISHKSNY